ncbi:MAG TPA: hypothetical protein DEP87_01330 [Candidatus Pacebacteria bacterium]|nr:hypothetical protein [Candidatus Paceibacterota bacterium]
MTHKLLTAAAFGTVLLLQTSSLAQASIFSDAKEKFLENQAERQENREERRGERRDNILENIADRVEKRFAKHEEKLNAWISRAETHAAKLKEKGKTVTEAEAAIATAKTDLATAKALGADAVAQLRAVEPADWSEQKTAAQAAKEAVKKAQTAFGQVLKDLKTVVAALKTAAKS